MWSSKGGASGFSAISAAKECWLRIRYIIQPISSTSAGEITMLKNLIEVGPLATTNHVSRIAPTAATITFGPSGLASPPETSAVSPSMERPNIMPSTASQPIVRNTTARK
ncbi:hypothetical protein [Albidovulum sp.]|uniref:hypothetical protein n=1 Tax=Albidovulum sp. TaxID=1872424 RepID=UPI003023486A